MNLFLLGWRCGPEERARGFTALKAMHETFPLLDPATASVWNGRSGFAAWMHNAPDSIRPRRYVYQSGDALVLYDGTAVATDASLVGHDAASLADRWADATDRLEGAFVLARLDRATDSLELANDPFGIHTTYVSQRGATWWISNSVRLLAAAARLTDIDAEGVAACVAMASPGGDRTLLAGASKLPAGQRWTWSGADGPETTTHWPTTSLATLRKRTFDARAATELTEALTGPLRTLEDAFGPLECPITGGRDSRVLTGITMVGRVPTNYFTVGPPDDLDVVHASAIAERFGLPHERRERAPEHMLQSWDQLRRRVIRTNDGMVTLMHARNMVDVPERLDRYSVMLYGAAGERARGTRMTPGFVLRPGAARAAALLRGKVLRGLSFLRTDARPIVLRHVSSTCHALEDEGFAPVDIPDAFSLVEHNRRWAASQSRQRADHKDVFVPYLTRAFQQAAFATPAAERIVQRVPYLLLTHASPELRDMPTSSAWPPRSLAGMFLLGGARESWTRLQRAARRVRRHAPTTTIRTRERAAVQLALLPVWRERFLDHPSSALWQVIDRERFEYVTSCRAAEADLLRHLVNLYQVATVFEYESDHSAWMDRWR